MKKLSHKHLIALAVIIGLIGLAALLFASAREAVPGIPEVMPIKEPMSEEACASAGGTWNPCASACPEDDPDAFCIQVCVERCEF